MLWQQLLQVGKGPVSHSLPSVTWVASARFVGALRETSTKAFSGRKIAGIDEVTYDVDTRLPGESQVQLEVNLEQKQSSSWLVNLIAYCQQV